MNWTKKNGGKKAKNTKLKSRTVLERRRIAHWPANDSSHALASDPSCPSAQGPTWASHLHACVVWQENNDQLVLMS
jgi:hypothetical protein